MLEILKILNLMVREKKTTQMVMCISVNGSGDSVRVRDSRFGQTAIGTKVIGSRINAMDKGQCTI